MQSHPDPDGQIFLPGHVGEGLHRLGELPDQHVVVGRCEPEVRAGVGELTAGTGNDHCVEEQTSLLRHGHLEEESLDPLVDRQG